MTDAVEQERKLWQNRGGEQVYPIVLMRLWSKPGFLERFINKAIHLALEVNLLGTKELLGMWMTHNESALILAASAHKDLSWDSDLEPNRSLTPSFL